MTENHYHSTTHEVIGIKSGEVTLILGDSVGKSIAMKAGDLIIIPASVGHYSSINQLAYEAVGGYPNGTEWDMIFNEKDKHEFAMETIRKIPIPQTDPLLGSIGLLFEFWK